MKPCNTLLILSIINGYHLSHAQQKAATLPPQSKCQSLFDASGRKWINANINNYKTRTLLQVLLPYIIENDFMYRLEHYPIEIHSEEPVTSGQERTRYRSFFKAHNRIVTIEDVTKELLDQSLALPKYLTFEAPPQKNEPLQSPQPPIPKRIVLNKNSGNEKRLLLLANPFQIVACHSFENILVILHTQEAFAEEKKHLCLSFFDVEKNKEINLDKDKSPHILTLDIMESDKTFESFYTLTLNEPLSNIVGLHHNNQLFILPVPEEIRSTVSVQASLNLLEWAQSRGVVSKDITFQMEEINEA